MLDLVGDVLTKAARAMVMAWSSTPPVAPSYNADLKDMDQEWYDRMRCFLYGIISGTYLAEINPDLAQEIHNVWAEMFKDQTTREEAMQVLRESVDAALAGATGGRPEDMPDV